MSKGLVWNQKKIPVQAILFDIDGTLIDSKVMAWRVLDHLYKKYLGHGLHDELASSFSGMPTRQILAKISPDDEAILQECVSLSDRFRHLSYMFPDVRDTLEQLHQAGILMGIVTSQTWSEIMGLRRYFKLDAIFNVWVTSDDVSNPKPDGEPVQAALDALNALPETTLFIGDTYYDLLAGKSAGVWVGAALWGSHEHDKLLGYKPDFVFYHPEEILGLCQQ
jgi:HAD superfamily hydrolase (TIGR01509 family)